MTVKVQEQIRVQQIRAANAFMGEGEDLHRFNLKHFWFISSGTLPLLQLFIIWGDLMCRNTKDMKTTSPTVY